MMGILNVTPDSFAESSPRADPAAAVDFALRMARSFAARLEREAARREEEIRSAFELALSRAPGKTELRRALDFLDNQAHLYQDGGVASERDAAARALVDFCGALFASNEFVYIQ